KLTSSRSPSQPENAGIVAYQDDHNFVKLMFRAVIKTTRVKEVQPGTVDLIIEENDITKTIASFDLKQPITGDNNLFLRLIKKGSTYTANYSLDGDKFETLGTTDILLRDVRGGLIVSDGIVTQY